mmetsp:Transcript_26786/g.66662  ORF Transcript_26786/g.66662 Transcript_26786/m.66662 type:complete len:276 (-) Transcript_26786:176-1003(-)
MLLKEHLPVPNLLVLGLEVLALPHQLRPVFPDGLMEGVLLEAGVHLEVLPDDAAAVVLHGAPGGVVLGLDRLGIDSDDFERHASGLLVSDEQSEEVVGGLVARRAQEDPLLLDRRGRAALAHGRLADGRRQAQEVVDDVDRGDGLAGARRPLDAADGVRHGLSDGLALEVVEPRQPRRVVPLPRSLQKLRQTPLERRVDPGSGVVLQVPHHLGIAQHHSSNEVGAHDGLPRVGEAGAAAAAGRGVVAAIAAAGVVLVVAVVMVVVVAAAAEGLVW